MEAKIPANPYGFTERDKIRHDPSGTVLLRQNEQHVVYEKSQKDMLKFFVDFLDEHIELCKERKWDCIGLEAIKINFKCRFMGK